MLRQPFSVDRMIAHPIRSSAGLATGSFVEGRQSKILILSSQPGHHGEVVECLKTQGPVTEITTIDEAIDALRRERFDYIFSDTADFLPLERALVSQQASLILNTLGEGVCIVDGEGR